jgi:hypothetical protein
MPNNSALSDAANDVIAYHQRQGDNEPRYAKSLVGTSRHIQSFDDLDDAYKELQKARLIEWVDASVTLVHSQTGTEEVKSLFRLLHASASRPPDA